MGFINKNCNLYNKKGQLLQKVGRYPTGNAPMIGNYDVMMIGTFHTSTECEERN